MPYDNSRVLRIRNRFGNYLFKARPGPTVAFAGSQASLRLLLSKKVKPLRFCHRGCCRKMPVDGRKITAACSLPAPSMANCRTSSGWGTHYALNNCRPETQELGWSSLPIRFRLPFGVDFHFNLYKRDTSFWTWSPTWAFNIFSRGNYIKAFWNNRSSSLLTVDEQQLEQQQQLPPTLDVRNAYFGLEYALQRLDYRFNPRKGGPFSARRSRVKRIERNNRIVELGYGELYDTLALRGFSISSMPGWKVTCLCSAVAPSRAACRVEPSLPKSPSFSMSNFALAATGCCAVSTKKSILPPITGSPLWNTASLLDRIPPLRFRRLRLCRGQTQSKGIDHPMASVRVLHLRRRACLASAWYTANGWNNPSISAPRRCISVM